MFNTYVQYFSISDKWASSIRVMDTTTELQEKMYIHHTTYPSNAPSEGGESREGEGPGVAQLPADHVGVVHAPVGLTDGAPDASVEDLHPPLAGTLPAH